MKTFVTIGEYGLGEDYEKHVLYAGINEEDAKEFSLGTYDILHIQVWFKKVMINELHKNTEKLGWREGYNRIEILEKSISSTRKLLEKEEKELTALREVI